jgi:hypothetical protein
LAAFGGWASDPNGKYGQGLKFNGIDASLGIDDGTGNPDDDALPTGFPLNHSSYTLAAWVNTTFVVNDGNSSQMGIIGWGAYGAGARVNALRLASDLNLTGGGAGIRHYWWAADLDFADTATVDLADGTYHHIAATYDDSTGMRSIYVDGNLVVSDMPPRHHARTGDFRIGRTCSFCGGASGELFEGTMDDVAVFNESLSQSEIQKIMGGDFSDFGVP